MFAPEVVPAGDVWHKCRSLLLMKKPKKTPEVQLLELLKQILPKAAPDPDVAGRIYQAVEHELRAKARATAFEGFCARVALPDLEPPSLAEVKEQLEASFGDGEVTIEPSAEENLLRVEVTLPDGNEFASVIKVDPNAAAVSTEEQEPEIRLKFVPFPVALPADPELVWLLARHETLTPEEGGMALARAEEEFWASKTGQKLQRDRVEKTFPEFIARVPAGLLKEVGLKRHYKEPEPVKEHRAVAPQR